MRQILTSALRVSLVTWVLCGLAYPLAVTGLAQWVMPWQANGSLTRDSKGEPTGSYLIGQQWEGRNGFTDGLRRRRRLILPIRTRPWPAPTMRTIRLAPISARPARRYLIV